VFEWEKRTGTLFPNAKGVRPGAEDRAPKARGLSMQLEVWGSAVCSPSGSGRSQAAKRHLVHFWSENALSGKALKGHCKCLLAKKLTTDYAKSFSCQTDSSAKNQFLTLSHLATGRRSKFSLLLICSKVIKSHSEREILCLMMHTRLKSNEFSHADHQTMSTTGVSKFRPVSAKRSNEL